MLIHVDLLRVSLSSVSRLLWHKPCLVVACYLLKTTLASVSMLLISSSFPCFHSLMAALFALTRGVCGVCAWIGGDVLLFFSSFFFHTSTFHSNFHKADIVCCIP